MKPECLRRLQSFGWWSKPSGRFICQPWSISWDKLLMSNLQMHLPSWISFPPSWQSDCKVVEILQVCIDCCWCCKQIQGCWTLLITSKEFSEVSEAFQTICERGPLRWPKVLQVDLGHEFMGDVKRADKAWCEDKKREYDLSQRSGNCWAI